MEKLTPEQTKQINTCKTKLKNMLSEVKSILEQGRLISSDPSQLFLFKGMYRELKPCFDTFNDNWDQLTELFQSWGITGVFPSENEKNLQQLVKRYYYESCSIYEFHMNPTPAQHSASAATNTATLNATLNDSRTVRARLPQINLPQFTGNPPDWPLFRDTFISLIHDEPTLSNIEKFHFLVSCLRGPALSLIKGVPLQEATYEQAWKILRENYDDKRRLATNYLKIVLNYTPIKSKPSASSLKHLLTTVIESVTAFKQLKIPQGDDFILTYLALRCLDPVTRKDFERAVSHLEFPTFDKLVEFLKSEWKSLDLTYEEEVAPQSRFNTSSNSKTGHIQRKFETTLLAEQEESHYTNSNRLCTSNKNHLQNSCPVCKLNHTLYHCDSFRLASPEDKLSYLKDWTGCINCLSSKHKIQDCKSPRRCQICKMKHHSWLHVAQPNSARRNEDETSQLTALSGTSCSGGEVILGTAIVNIKDHEGKYQPIRLVTDCGSQHSFITHECAIRLGLPLKSETPPISGIGQVPLNKTYGLIECSFRPRMRRNEFSTKAIVIQGITNHLPHAKIPYDLHHRLKAYELADPTYWKPQEVDFLLGADLYFDIITGAPLNIGDEFPRLIPSKLGYIVAGKYDAPQENRPVTSLVVQTKQDISNIMNKFWEIEELPKEAPLSEEELYCEQYFETTHYRTESGRYVVALPLKPSINKLLNPKQQVLSRFINLEHKLDHRPILKQEYHKFMNEYLALGHMQPAQQSTRYLIPHHGVSKIENGKIKLRVVFDASCHSASGSLNDHLMTGPKLHRDIFEVLIGFRTYAEVIVADIVKMYRQILVRPEDRPFQHILWRSSTIDPIQTMELTTVTQGINSSSFLASRTLLQLSKDEGHAYPLASRVLEESIYVDDIVTGAETLEEALSLQKELVELLQLGGFELSKWKSNNPKLLLNVQGGTNCDPLPLSNNEDFGCKILGLQWLPTSDAFMFQVEKPIICVTKRGILSTIARIYDPLGFLSPVVFLAKIILQDTWHAKCDWDDVVPLEIKRAWSSLADELHTISAIKIPRYICFTEATSYEIIGFSDASQRGYSAVLYLKARSVVQTKLHLLKAKTKLAPTKIISIPRLELCGALLIARLLESCRKPLGRLNVMATHLFTDSTIVLGWLRTPLNQLKVFVAHRISEILQITTINDWQHVSSESNPADCASRGLLPQELEGHPLWWVGPRWLRLPNEEWPRNDSCFDINELPETKPSILTVLLTTESPSIIQWMTRFSSYMKMLRSFCYALRFIRATHNKSKFASSLSLTEIEEARIICIKIVQEHHLLTNQKLLASQHWKSLAPFQDYRGLVRVGGRLENSNLSYSVKHPIILPHSHFTLILIDYYHKLNLLIGPTSLQATLLNRYFIISARKLIRSRTRQCVTCQTITPKQQPPFMGNLPSFRLEEGQIFQHVGVDLAGPFPLKESNRRKAALGKAYLCLFICMVTKAVHLEVVTSCSTEAFIAALHRFTSRRGRPQHIYSDCGTNFKGAASELREFKAWFTLQDTQQGIINFTNAQEIEWHFNPPHSPHFGGLWEAGIKCAKKLLHKNIGQTPLTYEELATLFHRIEVVLNSRPLYPVGSDPTAMDCLTPGHFLIGRQLNALPERSLLDVKENCLRRWQLIQHRVQHFWKLWRSCHLNQLQQSQKWTTQHPNIKEGDLVILKDTDCPPTRWPLARVIETHSGSDGIVRVATIRTPSGIYKRPVIKLIPLLLPNFN